MTAAASLVGARYVVPPRRPGQPNNGKRTARLRRADDRAGGGLRPNKPSGRRGRASGGWAAGTATAGSVQRRDAEDAERAQRDLVWGPVGAARKRRRDRKSVV